MLIGLISDTHIFMPEENLPLAQIKEAFKDVSLILHAGDIYISRVLDDLETIAPVLAAQGDDDMNEDIGQDKRGVKKQVLHIEGLEMWVTHMRPRYEDINHAQQIKSYNTLFRRYQNVENTPPPDVVVFGHSHEVEREDLIGTLLVNPGSATVPKYLSKHGTVGLLNIFDGKVEVQIVQLE